MDVLAVGIGRIRVSDAGSRYAANIARHRSTGFVGRRSGPGVGWRAVVPVRRLGELEVRLDITARAESGRDLGHTMQKMSTLWEILHSAAAPLCHQLPDRTMTAGDLAAPVCIRCSAFYGAFLIGVAGLTRARPLTPTCTSAALLALALMGCDALLWSSNNLLRHLTGVCAGLGLAAVATPVLARTLKLAPSDPSAMSRTRIWLGFMSIASLLLLYPWSLTGSRSAVVASILGTVLGFVTLGFTVNALLIGTWFRTSGTRMFACGILLAVECIALVLGG
jgi:uncharacterized membrane protein